jgi:hypothetical protein
LTFARFYDIIHTNKTPTVLKGETVNNETEIYFRHLNEMFRTEGWQIFLDDIKQGAVSVNSIELAKDEQDLYFRKGQLAVMANILNIEAQVAAAQAEAEADDAEAV